MSETENRGFRDNRNRGFNNRNSGPRFNNNRSNEQREMFKVTCSDCNAETEVPFKPTEGRPVYCRDCYKKHKPQYN